MMTAFAVQGLVERALAFAHAALDDTTPHRVAEARTRAAEVLPHVARMKPRAVPMSDARQLFELVGQLRATLAILNRKVELTSVSHRN
jgi:hypothetical protein